MEEEQKLITADTEIVSAEQNIDETSMARRYCLTLNNPAKQGFNSDEEMLSYLEEKVPDVIKYAIFQREKGEETGTEHFQMFIQLASPMRFRTFKKLFPKAHIEKALGTNLDARDYCKKEDTRISGPYEVGIFSEERSRTDYKSFYQAVEKGLSDEELRNLYPSLYVKMEKSIDKLRQDNLRKLYGNKLKEDFIVVYIYGKSGAGKTYNLFQHYGSKAYMITEYAKHPFDDYKNEDVIIFDDYRSQIDFSMFLRLLDIYPINLPRRFNNVYGNYTKVFITTNNNLLSQYSYLRSNDLASWKGLERRIHFILNYVSQDKILLEVANKPIEDLMKIIPDSMKTKLDISKVAKDIESANKQVKMFEVVEDGDLPF